MKKHKIIFLAVALFLIFAGCKKDSNNNNNTVDSPSVIQLTTPTASTILLNGTTLQVRGNITDVNGLSSAKLEIKNSTGTILYQVNTPTGSVTYFNLNWDWLITGITTLTPATLTVTATDYNSKQISKQINITLID